jgi:hypothetical protein
MRSFQPSGETLTCPETEHTRMEVITPIPGRLRPMTELQSSEKL